MTDELIDRLAADLRPVRPLGVARRLAAGVGAGALGSALLTRATLGFRPGMGEAAQEAAFWIKLAYTLALLGSALFTCEILVRPAGDPRRRIAWIAAPLLAIALLAAWQLVSIPADLRGSTIMGGSAGSCPLWILANAALPFIGLVWAARGLAPTRLRLTGLMIGLAAGGAGASVYALHCTEGAAAFLAVWYTLGVAGAGMLGALLGPRVLRWS